MLQDARYRIRFVSSGPILVRLRNLVFTGGLCLLTSCGVSGRGGETRLVDHRYLTPSGEVEDAEGESGEGREAESEFGRIEREMFGDDTGDGLASASLDDFAGVLDSYLKEARAEGDPDRADSVLDSNISTSRAFATDEEKSPEKPRVKWQRPTAAVQPTPADRAEQIGSNKVGNQGSLTPILASRFDYSGDDGTEELRENTRGAGGRDGRVGKGFSLDEIVVLLSAKLHQNAARSSMPLREYMVDASMLMLDPSRRIDAKELYGLNKRERELLGDLQEFFIDVGKRLRETPDAEAIVEAVSQLSRGLGSGGQLEIPTFRLCTAVENFGTYEEIETLTFVRGRRHQLITYIEVANFKPRIGADGRYKTTLTQESELHTEADGTLADSQPAVTVEDYCRNIRQDFFLVRHWTLSANLSVGAYYLKVRVTDEVTKQEAEAVVRIEIVASNTYR